jgi:hypothetical protein
VWRSLECAPCDHGSHRLCCLACRRSWSSLLAITAPNSVNL